LKKSIADYAQKAVFWNGTVNRKKRDTGIGKKGEGLPFVGGWLVH
jgi:hypothetical protein